MFRSDQRATRKKEREARAQRKSKEKRRRDWMRTDHGRARLAHDAGEFFFQVQRVISTTRGEVLFMGETLVSEKGDTGKPIGRLTGELAGATKNLPITQTLAVIESIGWRLVDVNYIYRQTASAIEENILASGQRTATSGEVVAIYLFRRLIAQNPQDG